MRESFVILGSVTISGKIPSINLHVKVLGFCRALRIQSCPSPAFYTRSEHKLQFQSFPASNECSLGIICSLGVQRRDVGLRTERAPRRSHSYLLPSSKVAWQRRGCAGAHLPACPTEPSAPPSHAQVRGRVPKGKPRNLLHDQSLSLLLSQEGVVAPRSAGSLGSSQKGQPQLCASHGTGRSASPPSSTAAEWQHRLSSKQGRLADRG